MDNLWVFDLDGTLLFISHDYSIPELKAAIAIAEELGEHCPYLTTELIPLMDEVDKRRVDEINPKTGKRYGYGMDRFPTSIVASYRIICDRAGIEPNPDFEKRLIQIGLEAFSRDRYEENVKDGAPEILKYLKEDGDRLVLLTKGDERVQNLKLDVFDDMGIGRNLFDETLIVDSKHPELFARILEEQGDYMDGEFVSITVGNNYHKDIQPALDAGFSLGIFIPEFTWEEERPEEEEVDDRCVELEDIREIAGISPERLVSA